MVRNKWWNYFKSRIRSFTADYSRRHNLDKLACEERVVKLGDSYLPVQQPDILYLHLLDLTRAKLAPLLIKKYQAMVVRARLKRIPSEATNMSAELCAEALRNVTNHNITSVTLPQTKEYVKLFGLIFRSYLQGNPV